MSNQTANDKTVDKNPAAGGITAITLRTYITALGVLAALMVAALVLTRVLPAGEFERVVADGAEVVVPGSYHAAQGELSLVRWALSPLLVLGAENNIVLIMLLVFLFVIGGAFYALESCGVLSYLIARVAKAFEQRNRLLLFVLPLVFMLLGTLIGSFEEVIPLTALVVALALRLGWDREQGLGMSLLAVGCGFAVGVMNPFTTGVAQTVAGLGLFSGAWLRIVSFVLVYAMLMAFLLAGARRAERAGAAAATGDGTVSSSPVAPAPVRTGDGSLSSSPIAAPTPPAPAGAPAADTTDPRMDKALRAFALILIIGIVLIIACSVVPLPGLSDLVFPACALTFLLCGLVAPLLSGCGLRQLGQWFAKGVQALAPSALLVLMASSISFMLREGRVLDTIIYYAGDFLADKPGWLAILGVYVLVMLLEFAIPSGSAKAFLLIPLVAPLVDLLGIPRQLAVLAYIYGDGFTNVFYPTNPALLIALSISGVSFGQWLRRTWPFMLGLLALTSTLLVFGLAIGYS